jgi:hypothetical protein
MKPLKSMGQFWIAIATAEVALRGDQNTGESGSLFTTENGSLLKDR